MMKNLFVLLAVLAVGGAAFAQTNLLVEDFEDTTVEYTTSVPEFSDGYGDFWFNTSSSLTYGTFVEYNGADGGHFAGMDLDGEGATLPLVMDFAGIDISGYADLQFSIDLAEDDDGTNEDWDLADYVHIQYQIDGGGFQDLIWIESIPDGDAYNSVPALDNNFDGDGDGTVITDTFATFNQAITGTGNTLDIKIIWELDSGDEDLAMDNVTVTGVPEPATMSLLAIGGLVAAVRRRRK